MCDNEARLCWDCECRIGEECDMYGHEIYDDTEAGDCFEARKDVK